MGVLLTERRSRRPLHAFLSHLASWPDSVPGIEQLTLLGVDQDGKVHLMHMLFSVLVGLYSSDRRLFACCGDMPLKYLPLVV